MKAAGDEATELTDVLTVSRMAVYPVDTRGLGIQPDLVRRRGGFPSPASHYFDHTNMDLVAEQTGGKAYYNTNDFTRVIEDVVRTGSSYYTIAYATNNTKWNGELRRIKVTRGPARCDLAAQRRLLRLQPRQAGTERDCSD